MKISLMSALMAGPRLLANAGLIGALSFTLSACSTTRAEVRPDHILLTGGEGGTLTQTFTRYNSWQTQNKRFVIDGRMMSADAFAAFSMPNACYTKNAVFAPHAASLMGVVPNYQATEWLTQKLPVPLQKEFRNSGHYYNWITTARYDYDDLKRIWPEGEC